jgi:hypothetical protein
LSPLHSLLSERRYLPPGRVVNMYPFMGGVVPAMFDQGW